MIENKLQSRLKAGSVCLTVSADRLHIRTSYLNTSTYGLLDGDTASDTAWGTRDRIHPVAVYRT
jgi:hypothetical protein